MGDYCFVPCMCVLGAEVVFVAGASGLLSASSSSEELRVQIGRRSQLVL
jgi:hypothetical protein